MIGKLRTSPLRLLGGSYLLALIKSSWSEIVAYDLNDGSRHEAGARRSRDRRYREWAPQVVSRVSPEVHLC
ncbi:MAG: hypothetical protein H0U94_03085 [Acidobacteria bacterium]|nr:hypothetical protein [Acidobacteriota bacterium]